MVTRQLRRRAFSVIELLTVLLIVAIVLAIVVPSLAAIRRSSRSVETRTLMTLLSNACVQFETDNRRLPGYFSAADLGHSENEIRGFTTMQNVMLDLAGGLVQSASATPIPGVVTGIGPRNGAANQIAVNVDLIGAGSGGRSYFNVASKFFARQDGSAVGQRFGAPANATIPELVDSHGTPILMWMQDPAFTAPIEGPSDFARVNADGGSARYYWAQNSAFLNSDGTPLRVGRLGRSQATESLLGRHARMDAVPPETRPTDAFLISLRGFLGRPGSALDPTRSVTLIEPAEARGRFVIHSAGSNGIFLARAAAADPIGGDIVGAKLTSRVGSLDNVLSYGLNYRLPNNDLQVDDANQPSTRDVLDNFDDIVVPGT